MFVAPRRRKLPEDVDPNGPAPKGSRCSALCETTEDQHRCRQPAKLMRGGVGLCGKHLRLLRKKKQILIVNRRVLKFPDLKGKKNGGRH